MTILATAVVVLVFGLPLALAAVLLILIAGSLFSAEGSRVVRTTFPCPVRQRTVTADLVVAEGGATRPSSVLSCSAFADPRRVTCAQRCLELAEVRWGPPVGVFARWSLGSGAESPGGTHGPRPEPAVKAAA